MFPCAQDANFRCNSHLATVCLFIYVPADYRSVPPGMTKKWMAAVKEKTVKPFHVAFQPEFLRAVSCEEDARAPWQVVFGYMTGEEDVKARMSNAFLEFVNRDESKLTVLNIAEAEFMKLVHK